MAESEKMEAIKRAYAELILNTAKEAAERVMAAEVRSRQSEQELVSAKEEAALMLLRLKQINDAKMKEAEMRSLNQQRKSEELESQLNEAECIILDLRAELNQAQEELFEVKQRKLHCTSPNECTELRNMAAKNTCTDHELSRSSLNSVPDFTTFGGNDSSLDWCTLNKKCCSPVKERIKFTPECDVISGDNHLNLDQRKETELSRNGCTQRICAIETSLASEKFPVGERSNPSNNSTNIEIVKNDVGSTFVMEEKVQHGKCEAVSIVRRSLRKRKLKYWDDFLTTCELHQSHPSKKPRSASPHLSLHNASQVKSGDDGIKTESAECPRKEVRHTEGIPETMTLIDVLVKQEDCLS